jgi:hypothetical protein
VLVLAERMVVQRGLVIPYPSLRVEKEEERRGQKESEEYLQMVK